MTIAEPPSGDGDRIVDRSGDIDQRPFEEGFGASHASAGPLQALVQAGPRLPALSPPASTHSRAVQRISNISAPSKGLETLAQQLQKDLDKRFEKAKSQLDALAHQIAAQENRCVSPKLDDNFQQIRFQRQAALISNGPILADRLREERGRLEDLEAFKAENNLSRDAHYSQSLTLSLGFLFILILIEAAINGVLFADSSEQGLLGGWLEAFVLSLTNIGAAFLAGRLVFPQLSRRGILTRAASLTLAALCLALIMAINLCGAHYRDFKAELAKADAATMVSLPKPERSIVLPGSKRTTPIIASKSAKTPFEVSPPQLPPAEGRSKTIERDAMIRVFETPFLLEGFSSVFLFVIGVCGAVIALLDGYWLDDPFPGYGKRHRAYAIARKQTAHTLRLILKQSSAIMDESFREVGRKVESHAQEMSELLALHHRYSANYKLLKESLDEAVRDAETEIACRDRLLNKYPDRDALELITIATKQLPSLPEKNVKFHETQEKKLKTLQKSVLNEQSDTLGIFDAASVDFKRLLSEASQLSLQSATPSKPAGH